MSRHLSCPHGHRWELPDAGPVAVPQGRPACPACGSPATLPEDDPAEARTLALSPVPFTQAPTQADDAAPSSTAARAGPPAVPGYEVLGELGRGGMGVVYLARQVRADRRVALKMILAGGHAGGAELARFRTEAEAIARIQHPNIVQVFEVGEHQGLPFFSLELCAGGSLEKKLDGTPLPPREAAALAEALARAMAAAHRKGIVHRDLKPGNVLLAEDGTPKITDFGLAKKIDGESGAAAGGLTQTGAIMGTPSYMAPEQAKGKKEVGPAADTYALGAILYECLTGRPPFRAATAVDTVLQVVAAEPVPPSRLQPKVPRDLDTICLKCLEKEPHKRYASAQALADDLERFRTCRPIQARPAGPVERAWRWCRRRPAWAALAATCLLGLLTLLGGGVWFTRQLGQELRRTEQARRETAAAERRLELAFTHQMADGLDSDLRQLAAVPRTMALLLGERADWSEEQLAAGMRDALASEPRLFGLCAAFEPSEFERGREDFALYVYHTPDGPRRKYLLPPGYQPLYREWEWYRGARDADGGRWGEPYFDEGGGDVPMVTFSAPVRRRGRFVGVVSADLSIDYFKVLQDNLRSLNFGPDSYGFVVSPTGRFVSHPDARFGLRQTLGEVARDRGDGALAALVGRVLRGEAGEGRATDFATRRPARFLFAPVKSSNWSVVAVVPDADDAP